ncbi:endopeptidase La [Kangiella sp. HZ709]|uniref:endopeptidase La n=1 Tax=Kangiella sp. HZ709 TaxID=2666328 RepID=UPI0012AF104F|nr:endopeptidase La [Kangiella sp. HZ709]
MQSDTQETNLESKNKQLPLLPLRDVVVFPHMVIPLFVGREKSILALEEATNGDKQVMLVAQKEASEDMPEPDQLYTYGCVATILQMLKLPDGNVKVLVEGVQRAKVTQYTETEPMYVAEVETVNAPSLNPAEEDGLARAALSNFDKYVKLNKKVPSEILTSLSGIDEPSRLADSIAAHMALNIQDKQQILEMENTSERLEHLMSKMEGEMELLQVEKRIRSRVKNQMEKNQREYYLNEQIKAIQKELGDGEETASEHEELANKIAKSGMNKEAKEKAEAELKKLKMMSPMSAEATVVRGYIDWLLGVPWKKRSKVKHDLNSAEDTLNSDHYGLEKVKERILEYLAVQQRVKKLKGPVLCLVGPPGVGKTSLGQSIAKATGRKYVRMALGGVRDEAEIRGHRRTYIGAMPGKIMQKMSKVSVKNPLFLLDEIDKMAMDMRGDPSSALLEVLDPEQNHTFNDHYLEVDYDLSEVMFIATSNSMNIPAPLLDRMEVIRIPGYTEDEKVEIATRYLLPKQMTNAGLRDGELQLSESGVRSIIRYYTRESGVRNLERELAKICRKTVKEQLLAKKEKKTIKVHKGNIDKYLGVQRFDYGKVGDNNQIGQVTGLAWTSVGGELLTIESVVVGGKGKTSFTGQLGDVMKESIQAAMTVVRSRCLALGIEPDFYEKKDIHVHVPEGATPKDGPSAGIGMCTALISSLTEIPVRKDVAMTGEITLRGEVLPIGGLKEKLLAAHRGGIKTVMIPKDNERDLADIPSNIKKDLEINCVKWIDEVIDIALERPPEPKSLASQSKSKAVANKSKQQEDIHPH